MGVPVAERPELLAQDASFGVRNCPIDERSLPNTRRDGPVAPRPTRLPRLACSIASATLPDSGGSADQRQIGRDFPLPFLKTRTEVLPQQTIFHVNTNLNAREDQCDSDGPPGQSP